MLLLLSAISASIDSFVIGINFKLNRTKITKLQFLEIFSLTYISLFFLHFMLALTSITFTSKWLAPIIYICLGILALLHQEKENPQQRETHFTLTKKEMVLLILSHSSDGFVLSITFLNQYSYPFLCLIFSLTGIFFTILGYKIAKNFPHSEFISAIFFFILAFISCF